MLHAWNNFFATAAQASAALIGLLFVTVTVSIGFSSPNMREGSRLFLTPTFIHFVGSLFVSLIALAPWMAEWPLGVLFGIFGLIGVIHQISIVRPRRELVVAQMTWVEWIPYAVMPSVGSFFLRVGAVGLILERPFAPPAIAASIAVLLLSGIYGAWDLTLRLARTRGPEAPIVAS